MSTYLDYRNCRHDKTDLEIRQDFEQTPDPLLAKEAIQILIERIFGKFERVRQVIPIVGGFDHEDLGRDTQINHIRYRNVLKTRKITVQELLRDLEVTTNMLIAKEAVYVLLEKILQKLRLLEKILPSISADDDREIFFLEFESSSDFMRSRDACLNLLGLIFDKFDRIEKLIPVIGGGVIEQD